MGISKRWSALLVLVLMLLAACGAATPPQSSVPLKAGRYAVQWQAYIGGFVGQEIVIKLAFIDVASAQMAIPALTRLRLLTDQGEIAADVIESTRGVAHGDYRPFFATLRIAPLTAGTYTLQQVRYTDQTGQPHDLSIGDWYFDIRPAESNPLLEATGWTAGGTRFASMKVALHNLSSDPIIVAGLHANLPTTPLTTTLYSSQVPRALAATPQPASAGALPTQVETVTIMPGATETEIFFTFAPETLGDLYPFVQFQPFLRYHSSTATASQLYVLPLQTYLQDWNDGAMLVKYLTALPATAYAPF